MIAVMRGLDMVNYDVKELSSWQGREAHQTDKGVDSKGHHRVCEGNHC